MGSVWGELKRRNVFKVGVAYAVVAWVLIEAASIVLPTFEAPNWVMKAFTFLVIAGLPLALIVAWAFEITPEGLKREHEVDRSQSITGKTGRKLDFLIIGVLAVAVGLLLADKLLLTETPETTEIVVNDVPAPSVPADTTPSAPMRAVAIFPTALPIPYCTCLRRFVNSALRRGPHRSSFEIKILISPKSGPNLMSARFSRAACKNRATRFV